MVNLVLEPNINSHQPVYAQIKSRLRDEIVNGRLQSMSKLPSVRDLARAAGVSVGTMGRVVSELVDEGFCIRRPRIGIYINRENVISGQRQIIHLQQAHQPHVTDYSQMLLGVSDSELYPNCHVQSRYISPEILNTPSFTYELEKIRAERPDCLLAELSSISREGVSRMMQLPFPVLFVGDFHFGEVHDPELNLIREDTGERSYQLVKTAYAAGGRDVAFFGGNIDCFYVGLLCSGAERAARDFGMKLRYYGFSDGRCRNEEEVRMNRQEVILKMLAEGIPDAAIFDGYRKINIFADCLKTNGLTVGGQIKLITNSELIGGGIYLQPDYTPFRREAAQIINRLISNRSYHPGVQTMSGKITHRAISINDL